LLLCVTYLVSSYLGEIIFIKTLEDDFEPLRLEEFSSKYKLKSIIVVLGGGVVRGTPVEDAEMGQTSLKRLYKGYLIHKQTGFDVCLSGGMVLGSIGASEADVAKQVLLEWGVGKDRIITESHSNNTWENAVETCSVLRDMGYRRIILVTSAVHMRRAVYSFRKNWEYEIIPAPCDYLRGSDISVINYLPNRGSLDNCLRALHEWVGLLWYKVMH